MIAPTFDDAAEAEHRQMYPDRKCELAGVGKCWGMIMDTFGGHQLCGGHAMEFSEADYAGAATRLEAWVRLERAKGAS
jgi:hypothetical protein